MPEANAIQRTRDAMDAWLHKSLPADFNQLRADMEHILSCLPGAEPPDPITPMAGLAATMHELYTSLTGAGFADGHALYLVGMALKNGGNNDTPH